MAGYGWDEYDARSGGRQTIHDKENKIDITTQFVKVPGGSHGGNWGVRVNGKLRDDAPSDMASTAIFYVGLEGLGVLEHTDDFNELGYEGSVNFAGQTPQLGDFKVEITAGPKFNEHPVITHPLAGEKPLERTIVNTGTAPDAAIWQTKQLFLGRLRQSIDAVRERFGEDNPPPPAQFFTIDTNDQKSGNTHFIQKVFRGNFQFDVLFSSGSSPQPMDSEQLGNSLKTVSKDFSEAYKERFPAQSPFDKSKYDPFSKSLFSNLLGGIGYFEGDQVIDKSYADEYEEENEGFWEDAAEARARNQQELVRGYSLFTSVPSRPFFPRGFLWDEGFHLLPVVDWDLGVTLEILNSWFNTMDDDGWIPREQILGPEARSKVPAEFQTQYPHYANPPTLFLTLEAVLDKLTSKRSSLSDELKASYKAQIASFYPLLERNYAWYRKTQRGDIKSYDREAFSTREAYRWRGRTPTHILTSGLDDYPRAQPPHPGELHLDLMSWMGMMARSIKRIATFLDESEDAKQFANHEDAIARNIDDLHWDNEAETYCDATIDEFEESVHACHKGYISLFPFLTGLLPPDHKHLSAILDLIKDPDELWSNHGVRSLSQKDELYGTEENYWRSPVWMNINFLILEQLFRIATSKGPQQQKAQKMYVDLRKNLVETVYKSWKETGFAWEQYNPDTGAGQRTQHFTGWTSLVVKMMTMPDLSKGVAGHGEL